MSRRVDSIHDLHEVDEDGERDGSLEKLRPAAHRASVFIEHEHHEQQEASPLPRVWGRESQSGYKGRRVLGINGDEKDLYPNNGPLGAYAPNPTDSGKHQFANYELPQRYAGKQTPYRGDDIIPLAGNNNSWAPPPATKRRCCGLGRLPFWVIVAVICLLILCAAVGGMVVGIESSAKKAASVNMNSYATSTDVSSATNTITMANGIVVVTTQVFTSLRTLSSSASTTQSTSTTAVVSPTGSKSSGGSTPTTSPLSLSSRPASSSPSSTPTVSSVKPSSTFSSTATVLPLNCPSINGSTAKTTINSQVFEYTILCNTDFHSGDLQIVNASSILDCYNACAQYTHQQTSTCTGATFHANLSSVEGAGGNCNLKNDLKMSYITGESDTVAAVVLVVGSATSATVKERWQNGVLAVPWVE